MAGRLLTLTPGFAQARSRLGIPIGSERALLEESTSPGATGLRAGMPRDDRGRALALAVLDDGVLAPLAGAGVGKARV